MKRQNNYWFLPFFLCWTVAGQFIFSAEPFRLVENNKKKQLTFLEGTQPILTYQYDAVEHEHVLPNDLRRTAGCYVHPLYGLNGEILTDNAPADHYHHHGVFWTWPHVGLHEPDGSVTEYDLWTSDTALKQHFVCWVRKDVAEQTATMEVENGWYVGDPAEGKKIMTERVWIIAHRVLQVGDVTSRAVDFEFRWQPLDKPITLRGSEGKSYGGFSVRFKPFVLAGKNEAERSETNRITAPSGIAENDLPETPLAWADYTSHFPRDVTGEAIVTLDGKPVEDAVTMFVPKDQPSGASIFVPKSHPDFPPTWLTRYYGPLCVGWPGVKGRTFRPREVFFVRYRVWIHEGTVTVPQIEKAYQEYTH
ncbi:MAG: PmoA family protein [Planctomycetaceae bacterium]|jgi:hypothetical protein|nr:PmoA family protein [Planctomycetaceae bacterium]